MTVCLSPLILLHLGLLHRALLMLCCYCHLQMVTLASFVLCKIDSLLMTFLLTLQLAVAKEIIAKDGAGGLYKGLSAGLLRQATYTTARLGIFQIFSDMLKQQNQGKVHRLSSYLVFSWCPFYVLCNCVCQNCVHGRTHSHSNLIWRTCCPILLDMHTCLSDQSVQILVELQFAACFLIPICQQAQPMLSAHGSCSA